MIDRRLRLRALARAGVAAAALVIAPSSAAGSPVTVGVAFDRVPGATVLPSGVALLAWTAVDRGQRYLAIARRTAPGRPWIVRRLDAGVSHGTAALAPKLVPLGGSRVALVLSQPRAGGATVRISRDEGRSWHGASGALAGATPVAAAAAAGSSRIVLVWGGSNGLRSGALPADGRLDRIRTLALLEPGCCLRDASVGVDRGGRAHVAWHVRTRTGRVTRYAYLGRDGTLRRRLTLGTRVAGAVAVATPVRDGAAIGYLLQRGPGVAVAVSRVSGGVRRDTRLAGAGRGHDRPVRVALGTDGLGRLWVVWVGERGLVSARRSRRPGSLELGRIVTSRVTARGVDGLVALPDVRGLTVVVSTGRRAGTWTFRRARLVLP